MSKQAFEIIDKIREVDDVMTPELQRWVFEVHPEVSFYALNGRRPLTHSKHDRQGVEERIKLLVPDYPRIQDHLAELERAKVEEDDLLDAAAAAWTAQCVAEGAVPRQYDCKGLRMEIVH